MVEMCAHEWERGIHMAEAFGVDGRAYACAICGVLRTPKRTPEEKFLDDEAKQWSALTANLAVILSQTTPEYWQGHLSAAEIDVFRSLLPKVRAWTAAWEEALGMGQPVVSFTPKQVQVFNSTSSTYALADGVDIGYSRPVPKPGSGTAKPKKRWGR
jgi:hypothetical protein